MTQVIVAYGKHGTFVYGNSLALVKERAEDGWYDDPEKYEWIVNSNDEQAAWNFLKSRREHEYESVEIQTVQE